jgi:hypothetical protein
MLEKLFSLETKQPEFSRKSGGRLINVMDGLLGDMSSCPIMFTSFAERK